MFFLLPRFFMLNSLGSLGSCHPSRSLGLAAFTKSMHSFPAQLAHSSLNITNLESSGMSFECEGFVTSAERYLGKNIVPTHAPAILAKCHACPPFSFFTYKVMILIPILLVSWTSLAARAENRTSVVCTVQAAQGWGGPRKKMHYERPITVCNRDT